MTTQNFNTVQAVCNDAWSYSRFIGIVGYSGAGKTTALQAYAEGKENVFYVKASASMPARAFYSEILNAMGVEGKDHGINLYDMIKNLSFRLNYNDQRKLLIVDEAGKFKPKFMEYIHELRDNTEETTGIIFSGPEYFRTKLESWVGKNVLGMQELYRRINHWEYLSPILKSEVEAFCHHFGIKDKKFISALFKRSKNFSEVQNGIENYLRSKEKLK